MKINLLKGVLLFCSLVSFSVSYAQYGFEVNYGLNGIMQPSNSNFSHFGVGFFYDIDETFGAKVDFGSDKYRFDNIAFNEKTGVNVTRISVQGVINATTLLDRASSLDTFNVLAHGGVGYSMVQSTYLPGNDNIFNVIGGITPRVRIGSGFYATVDASVIFNVSQHYNFDGSLSYGDELNSFTGIMYNLTAGLVYKFNEF